LKPKGGSEQATERDNNCSEGTLLDKKKKEKSEGHTAHLIAELGVGRLAKKGELSAGRGYRVKREVRVEGGRSRKP